MRAIVFDFDGVLVDSEGMHERALREVVRAEGMDFTHEQYMSTYVGFDDRDAYRAICADNGRVLDDAMFMRLKVGKARAVERALEKREVPAIEGAPALARAAAKATRTAICSGALRGEIVPMLGVIGLEGVFGIIVSADDVPKAKPDPAGYRLTAQKLGAEPGACVAIEDTPTGIRAALAAGYRVVGVAHTFPASHLREAHLVAEHIRELTIERLFTV